MKKGEEKEHDSQKSTNLYSIIFVLKYFFNNFFNEERSLKKEVGRVPSKKSSSTPS